jgi:hypothetical protein
VSYDTYLFVHVHIRRSGGTTFYSQVLRNNFQEGFYRDSSLIHYQYTSAQFEQIIDNCSWLRAYSSHKVSLDLPFHRQNPTPVAIVFVRDPVDRVISQYFHHRTNSKDWLPKTKELSLSEYIHYALVEGHIKEYVQEGPLSQLEFISGSAGESALAAIEKLWEEGHLLLFPMEGFDQACVLLERLYPDHFTDCAYRRRNVSRKDQQVNNEQRQIIGEFIPPADFQLIRLAHQSLSGLLARHFKDEESLHSHLKDFQARCGKLAQRGNRNLLHRTASMIRKILLP